VASLADLGITADANGNYDTNTTTLSNALSSNLTSVGNLLGGTNGIATQIDNLINGYTQAGGLLATINQGLQTGLKQRHDPAEPLERGIGDLFGDADQRNTTPWTPRWPR
jgi:flagellar hook-associated protein 2